jgi:uncharacterized delta-60 repeat protein
MIGLRFPKLVWSVAAIGCISAVSVALATGSSNAGHLDRSFGENGKAIGAFCDHERDFQVALDAHHRLVVAGTPYHLNGFCLARYLPNGKLDRSFSGNGWVVTQFPAGRTGADSVAIDSRGRIVAGGAYGASPIHLNSFALARYKPDGSLDPSFGSGGLVRKTFGRGGAQSVTIDAQDRVVAVGRTDGGGFGVARFKVSGDPDPSFGTSGTVTTPSCCGDPESVKIDQQGRIVVGGYDDTSNGANFNFLLARYLPDGDPDNSFSRNGRVTKDLSGFDVGRSVAVDPRGRVLLGGITGTQAGGRRFAVLRYGEYGKLDASFGDGGLATASFTDHAGANSIGIDSRGRIVATGGGFDLARFRTNGKLDHSFSRNGKASASWMAVANSLAIDPRNRIDVVGWQSHLVLGRFFG